MITQIYWRKSADKMKVRVWHEECITPSRIEARYVRIKYTKSLFGRTIKIDSSTWWRK